MTSSKRRIAVVASNFWPERTGIGQVTTELADYLAGEGMDVTVATAMPYYPEWRIYEGYRGRLWRTERRGRMTIHRAWHRTSPAPGALSRIAHEVTLCLFSLPTCIGLSAPALRPVCLPSYLPARLPTWLASLPA